MTRYTSQHRMMKLASAQFLCNFLLFYCLESFCICFQMHSGLFCLHYLILYQILDLRMDASFVDQRKFLLLSWPHLFWEIFALKRQTLPFLYQLLLQIFLSNRAWYAIEACNYLTYPLKQDMPNSYDLVLFLNGVTIVLFCSGIPSLGCPIHIKSSRIYFIRLAACLVLL